MSQSVPDVDVSVLFPSLYAAIRRIRNSPYDAGWLASTIKDVSYYLMRSIIDGVADEQLRRTISIADDYIGQHAAVNIATALVNASAIDMTELLALLQHVHQRHLAEDDSSRSSVGVPLVVLGDRVANLLQQSVIAVVRNGDDELEVEYVNQGWEDAGQVALGTGDVSFIDTYNSNSHFSPVSPDEYSIPCPSNAALANQECSICYEKFGDGGGNVVLARCTAGHAFHASCLDQWVNRSAMENSNKCPMDREVICRARQHEGSID